MGKTRSPRELLEGWVIEGSDHQPGLLEILKSSKTPEVRERSEISAGAIPYTLASTLRMIEQDLRVGGCADEVVNVRHKSVAACQRQSVLD